MSHPLRAARTRRTRLAVGLAACALGLTAHPAGAAPSSYRNPLPRVTLPAAIDPLQPYVGQTSCDAVAKPGAIALLALLQRTYPGTTDLGIASSCAAEGMRSEHSEGRALDWGVSARSARGRAEAGAMLSWLFAADAAGDDQAMARRLGVMYVIWNGQIREAGGGWTTYLPGTCWTTGAHPKARGDDTTCHRNHVHISLGWSGAWKRTSFWTGRVAPVDYGPCVPAGAKRAPKYHGFNGTPCGGVRRGGSGSGGQPPAPTVPVPSLPAVPLPVPSLPVVTPSLPVASLPAVPSPTASPGGDPATPGPLFPIGLPSPRPDVP